MMILNLIFLIVANVSAVEIGSLKKVDVCKDQPKSKTMVYFIKQWHLNASEQTRDVKDTAKFPQAKNQEEIYRDLSNWIEKKEIDTVLAEGCEGEIDSEFKTAFNGWTYDDLEKESQKKSYSSVLTHLVLKLEAKYPKQLNSYCADNLVEVKNGLAAMSDMRGDVGFLSRLTQYRDQPAKVKTYLDGVIESFHLKKDASVDDAILVVKDDLKKSFMRFRTSVQARNQKVIERIKSSKTSKPISVVYGGLHMSGLKELAEKEGFNCQIFEPEHYDNNESQLLDQFEKALR